MKEHSSKVKAMDTCWRFESLTLNNFRQYEAFEMQFSPDVTLLIGENGAGKTAVLDALAILLSTLLRGKDYGGKSLDHVDARLLPKSLESVYATASVERFYPTAVAGRAVLAGQHFAWERRIEGPQNNSTWGNREVRDFSADMLAQAQKQEPQAGETLLPVIAYYGVERLVGERRKQGTIPTSRLGAYYSTLDPRSDLKRLSMFLESLDKQIVRAHAYGDKEPVAARRQFEAIDAACTEILSPVGWHSLRWNDHIEGVTLTHDEHGTLPLALLAAGTRIAASLAIDLASRMARANPHVGGRELLEQVPGIVLIDEVDLHLHPSWQQRIVPLLRTTFPQVQFVLTTHSPQVISTVEAHNVRILDGETVEVPKFAEGLRANIVLEQLQGVSPVPPTDSRKKLDHYLALVEQGQGTGDEALQLRELLDTQLGGAENNQELLAADLTIELAEWGVER